ncbi:MarR family winged helix-turn-helix transcriptional regulator [Phaeobacter sp. B1627]|uniref:MarR family winged helix-turn-helix transcriptional regulator n=1 Tax=Phaeobacter sp. B1627 TaxID=2583809 RepID=UPI0035189F9E
MPTVDNVSQEAKLIMDNTTFAREASAFFGDEDPSVAYNRVWFNVMRAHRKFLPDISRALKAEGVSDPIWYEILLEVARAGAEGQPMAELEKKLFVAQYALSRHVGRMLDKGLIKRTYISDGRRKQVLFLTDQGLGLHNRIWPGYMAAIQKELSGLMTTDEAYALSKLMIKLLS